MIRQGAYLCDIGTDHAYLPLYLLEGGVITRAVCSDINEKPLSSARRNAAERNMESKIDFVLTDGAEGLSSFGANDYSICGMGGELIIDIIERAEHLKKEGIHLILQPMTKCALLRRYLYENGFKILKEDYSFDTGKYYLTVLAEYDGVLRSADHIKCEIGDLSLSRDSAERAGYFENKLSVMKKRRDGKLVSGISTDNEDSVIREIQIILNQKK